MIPVSRGKHEYQVEDWSKIKYLVRYHWGFDVRVGATGPNIEETYFETFKEMQDFVQWYEVENTGVIKKIIRIQEIAKTFRVETYEVATKVRVVQ